MFFRRALGETAMDIVCPTIGTTGYVCDNRDIELLKLDLAAFVAVEHFAGHRGYRQ